MAEDISKQDSQEETTVVFDLDACTRCMACVANCPTKCLEEVDGDPVQTKPKDCIRCGTCEATCSVEAVKLKS
jgi:NAD-dependent dihydropyrimidine dehydrogenase PreA subunit